MLQGFAVQRVRTKILSENGQEERSCKAQKEKREKSNFDFGDDADATIHHQRSLLTRATMSSRGSGSATKGSSSSSRNRLAAPSSSSKSNGKSPHKSPHRSHRSHHHNQGFVPQTRQTEFRSVLRIRPSLTDEERSEPTLLSRDDLVHGGTGGHSATATAAAILRRPASEDESNDNNNSKSKAGISQKASSTLQYGMSMLRPIGGSGSSGSNSTASPMGRLATLRHGGGSKHHSKSTPSPSDRQGSAASGDDVGISYQFDSVLAGDADQDATYQSVGRVAALDATKPLQQSSTGHHAKSNKSNAKTNAKIANADHVIFALGTSRSGKTHTTIGSGGESCGGSGAQGLVPRLIDDLFRQYDADPQKFGSSNSTNSNANSNASSNSLTYAVRLTMVHVHGNKVYDMLSTSISESSRDVTNNANSSKRQSHASATSSVRKMVASMEAAGSGANASTSDNAHSGPEGDIQEVRLVKSSRTGLFRADANVETCREFLEAQETLYDGLDEVVVDGQSDTIKPSRGHTLITLQPVLVDDNEHAKGGAGGGDGVVKVEGGRITVVDMAVHEPAGSSSSSRRAVAATSGSGSNGTAKNETVTALLECLGAIQKQQEGGAAGKTMSSEDVAYRETKLTMLLQPLFSNGKGMEERKTVVTLLVAAHSGGNDYYEKKTLLNAVESLRGFSSDDSSASMVMATVGMEMTTPPRAPRAPTTPRASNTKVVAEAKATPASERSPLPPTHPQSAKKRDNPFALTDSTNADTPEQSAVVAAVAAAGKSKSPPKSKSPQKKKRSPVKSAASKSWLDISQEAPVKASHTAEGVSGATASESYSKKIKGFVDRSPLRKVGHAVSGVSSSITGAGGAGAKRLRMVGSKDEDDGMTHDQQRKVARKLEKDNIRLQDRIMHLEEDNDSLQRKNDSLEQKCQELMRENGNLIRLLEETKRNAYRSGLQQHAEKEAEKEEAEREARIRDQSLIKSPLMDHIKQVMGTSDEQMAWQLSTKAPYALNVPKQEKWTCADLYSHQKGTVITEMGVALASKVATQEKEADDGHQGDEQAMDIF